MVEEYDSFCKTFRKAVHENQDQGNLDLGNNAQSYLTACARPVDSCRQHDVHSNMCSHHLRLNKSYTLCLGLLPGSLNAVPSQGHELFALHCDADNIGQGSPLEMCYYLGKLQEENYLLSKPPKRKGEVDVMIKVPMLGYAHPSMVYVWHILRGTKCIKQQCLSSCLFVLQC